MNRAPGLPTGFPPSKGMAVETASNADSTAEERTEARTAVRKGGSAQTGPAAIGIRIADGPGEQTAHAEHAVGVTFTGAGNGA